MSCHNFSRDFIAYSTNVTVTEALVVLQVHPNLPASTRKSTHSFFSRAKRAKKWNGDGMVVPVAST